jgi:hypothetical protein
MRRLGWLLLCLACATLAGVGRAAPATCGDLDGDTVLEASDVARFRAALARSGAPLTLDEEIRCNATIDSSLPGGSTLSQAFDDDCTVLDVAILRRSLAGLWPEAAAICPAGAEGDCCTPSLSPGCDTPEVVACVCASLPDCCAAQWDAACAAAASTLTCGGDSPGAGACAADGGTPAALTWLEGGSSFRTAGTDWWSTTTHPRIYLADASGDGRADWIGIASNGDVWVARSTGTAFDAAALWRAATVFSVANGWWTTATHPRVWLADVTGDGRADVLGVANNGDLWVAESTGTTFNASHLVAASVFATPAFFGVADQQRVFVGDANGDDKADVVGIRSTGEVHVARASGSGTSAGFASSTTAWLATSIFTSAAEWFETASRARVWLADVTGDGAGDLVGLAKNGDLWVAEALPASLAFAATHKAGTSRLRTTTDSTTSFLSLLHRPRVFLGDATGDGRTDLVGIAPAGIGDGDVWLEIATGSGTTASFTERVALRESVYRTSFGWFALTEQPRVWLADVTGDARADLVGLANNGDVWVARSAVELGSPGAPTPGSRHFFQPSEWFGTSPFSSANGFLSTATQPRVFPADVTGDGASDLVGIASGSGAVPDGDVVWRMPVPAQVVSATQLTRQAVAAGGPMAIDVRLSRSVDPASFASDSLRAYLNGARGTPANSGAAGKDIQIAVQVQSPPGANANFDLELDTTVTDLWGNPLDGDGDGRAGGRFQRRRSWSGALLAGHARANLTEYPHGMAGLPGASGFSYCPTPGFVSERDSGNPPFARALVLAGGGTCNATPECRAGQTCVAGWCREPSGGDADAPLALVSVDLVGFNPARARSLIAARTGIAPERVVISATHAHAMVRNIHLFQAPYYDDRYSSDAVLPYQSWIENRMADIVADASRRTLPVELDTGSTAPIPALNYNRRFNVATDNVARFVRLRVPGGRVRAVLVNYANHPVLVGTDPVNQAMDADFPGFIASELENVYCPVGGCLGMFVNGGAGDVNPNGSLTPAQHGVAMTAAIQGVAPTWRSTAGMQLAFERRIAALSEGITSCNPWPVPCAPPPTPGPRNDGQPITWDAESTSVVIGLPHQPPALAFATLPGEPFSILQTRLRTNSPSTLLFGYTNGYLGYLPPSTALGDGAINFVTYGIVPCANAAGVSATEGPSFFVNSPPAPSPGERMVEGALDAIDNRLTD